MTDDLNYLLERYPSRKGAIIKAYETNDEFRSLVEDFFSTAKTLERYHQKMLKDVKNELEYRNLFVDLEREVLGFLSKPGSEPNAPRKGV